MLITEAGVFGDAKRHVKVWQNIHSPSPVGV